jgi:DNA-binding MarR family transcriptional regulator
MVSASPRKPGTTPHKAAELRFYHRLQLAAHRLHKTADGRVLEAAGVTAAQAAVLAIAAGDATATQRDIAAMLGLNESALTAMAARLIALGLLKRTRSATDGRAWKLSLTEEGHKARRKAKASFSGVNARIEAILSDQEIERLADCLDRLTKGFADQDG